MINLDQFGITLYLLMLDKCLPMQLGWDGNSFFFFIFFGKKKLRDKNHVCINALLIMGTTMQGFACWTLDRLLIKAMIVLKVHIERKEACGPKSRLVGCLDGRLIHSQSMSTFVGATENPSSGAVLPFSFRH